MRTNIYTDLAVEMHDLVCEEQHQIRDQYQLDGVALSVTTPYENIKITTVDVINQAGAAEIGKPIGKYITIDSCSLKENDIDDHEKIIEIISNELPKLYHFDQDTKVLVVGLGNSNVTPDALGPKTAHKVLVTRHIPEHYLPQKFDNSSYSLRCVSGVSPGVMGQTGIETAEIIKGIVDKTHPTLVIAIDALASRSTSRINATIQMSNTGVSPGTGMGNKRMKLNEETLGIPVIAIGVPTVVDAATLINDSITAMIKDLVDLSPQHTDFYKMLENMGLENRYPLIKDLLGDNTNMFVTPKEVDAVVERLSNVIANGINIALHQGITTDDINRYIY